MKTKLMLAAITLMAGLISCNKSGNQKDKTSLHSLMNEAQLSPLQKADLKQQQIPVGSLQQSLTDSGTIPLPVKAVTNSDWDKKIIKTTMLKLEVKDFKIFNENVHKTIKQFGGYIAQEEQNLTDEKSETVISIKVPVNQFETLMNQLPGGDVKVLEKKITTEDVTGEVVDIKARLEARKQIRLKYLEFLKQSKNMEEVLQVQDEINSIQEEIEAAAGRVDYLSHQSAFSTINLTFYQPLPGYKPVDETPSFFNRINIAFKTGASWVADLFVGLIAIWPLLLIVIGIYFGWKKIKYSKKSVINA